MISVHQGCHWSTLKLCFQRITDFVSPHDETCSSSVSMLYKRLFLNVWQIVWLRQIIYHRYPGWTEQGILYRTNPGLSRSATAPAKPQWPYWYLRWHFLSFLRILLSFLHTLTHAHKNVSWCIFFSISIFLEGEKIKYLVSCRHASRNDPKTPR